MNDLFVFDPMQLLWTDLTALATGLAPSPRGGAVFATIAGRFYAFGGWDSGTLHFFNDLFVLDPPR